MAALLIKDLPKDLHDRLKRRAVQNHRSMTKEALAILEETLRNNPKRPTLAQIKRWQIRGAKPLTDEILRRAKEGRE
jgi:plasmid stability protein